MSSKLLGLPIDIHGGGADLLFPHHESEVAQSEWASGQQPFTHLWMHIAMVRYQGEKMSKSLGNLVMVRDLLEGGWTADAIRLCLAANHYREPWGYEQNQLTRAAELSCRLREAVTSSTGSGAMFDATSFEIAFRNAMDDDLNSPAALKTLIELADEILIAGNSQDVGAAQKKLRILSGVLGLRLDLDRPEERVSDGWRKHRRRFE
jgi:cysteinyl-tRNA synthetase